ncbi:MAG: hypothetical protein AAF726_14985 [Planctomycetota bacterium]
MSRSSTSSSDPSDDRDLIDLGDDTTRTRATRWGERLAIGVFALVLLGSLALDLAAPPPERKLFGIEKAEFRKLRESARFSDGSLTAYLGIQQRIRSRTRVEAGSAMALARLKLLGLSSDVVIRGKDEWLFLRSRVGDPSKSVAELTESGALLYAAFDRRLAASGVELIAVPVPRKALMARKYFPDPDLVRPGIDRKIFELLASHGVDAVDLRRLLVQFEEHERFNLYGTHWSSWARFQAARAIAEHLGLLQTEGATTASLHVGTRGEPGLLGSYGIAETSLASRWIQHPAVRFTRPRDANGRVLDRQVFEGIRPVTLVGTSFSSYLARDLAHWIDAEVRNASIGGKTTYQSLASFLDEVGDGPLPEQLLMEAPVGQLVDVDLSRGVRETAWAYEAFAACPVTPTSDLGLPVTRRNRTWSLPRRVLATSGEGVALLRIRCDDAASVSRLWIRSGGAPVAFPWPDGATEILVPLLSLPGRGAERIQCTLTGPAPIPESTSVSIVTDLDLENAQRLGISDAVADSGGAGRWRQSLQAGVTLDAHSGLVFRVSEHEGLWKIRIRALTEEGVERTWSVPVRPGTTVVLGLDGLAGTTLDAIELSGPGDASDWKLDSAVIAPQLRAN